MLRNRIYGTNPVVLHNPGSYPWWELLVTQFMQTRPKHLSIPNATIITWNSKRHKSVLEKSLDHLGVPCVVLGRETKAWKNTMKIQLTREALKQVSTPYVLGIDGFDAIVVGDLWRVVELLEYYRLQIVFNATNLARYSSAYLFRLYSERYASHPFCHLNAGAWVADTNFAREFFREVDEVSTEDVTRFLQKENVPINEYAEHYNSEQLRVKYVAERSTEVGIDCECRAFQVLNETDVCKSAIKLTRFFG